MKISFNLQNGVVNSCCQSLGMIINYATESNQKVKL